MSPHDSHIWNGFHLNAGFGFCPGQPALLISPRRHKPMSLKVVELYHIEIGMGEAESSF